MTHELEKMSNRSVPLRRYCTECKGPALINREGLVRNVVFRLNLYKSSSRTERIVTEGTNRTFHPACAGQAFALLTDSEDCPAVPVTLGGCTCPSSQCFRGNRKSYRTGTALACADKIHVYFLCQSCIRDKSPSSSARRRSQVTSIAPLKIVGCG